LSDTQVNVQAVLAASSDSCGYPGWSLVSSQYHANKWNILTVDALTQWYVKYHYTWALNFFFSTVNYL